MTACCAGTDRAAFRYGVTRNMGWCIDASMSPPAIAPAVRFEHEPRGRRHESMAITSASLSSWVDQDFDPWHVTLLSDWPGRARSIREGSDRLSRCRAMMPVPPPAPQDPLLLGQRFPYWPAFMSVRMPRRMMSWQSAIYAPCKRVHRSPIKRCERAQNQQLTAGVLLSAAGYNRQRDPPFDCPKSWFGEESSGSIGINPRKAGRANTGANPDVARFRLSRNIPCHGRDG